MISTQPAPPSRLRIRWARVAGLLCIAAAVVAVLHAHGAPDVRVLHGAPAHPLGQADGALPDGTTVFDDVPGVARLDPDLRAALRRAADDSGVPFVVNSGWRSSAYENRLRREAVARYGSVEEASKWVATGTTSPHVSGDAVDLGTAAASWLGAHGAAYGLCRIYANEPWHFELRSGGCPALYADPTQDPRMQR